MPIIFDTDTSTQTNPSYTFDLETYLTTKSLPNISFYPNSGIYNPGNNEIRIFNNNTDTLTLTATNNVGIGKTNPSTILDVNGTITGTNINATTNLQENGTNLISKYALISSINSSNTNSSNYVLSTSNIISNRITNLTTTNITEGTNLYYTDTRVNTRLNSCNLFFDEVFPIAWYKLDNGTLTTDSSGNGYNLTIVGGTSNNITDYVRGNASATFNGTTQYLQRTNFYNLNSKDFTICYWIKGTTNSTNRFALTIGTASISGQKLHLGYRNTNVITMAFYNDDLNSSAYTTDAGNWIHLGFTYDNATKTKSIYRNGVLIASGVGTGDLNTNNTLNIGFSTTSTYLNGLLDDIRFYNVKLSQSQIVNIMNGSIYNSLTYVNINTSNASLVLEVDGNMNCIGNIQENGTNLIDKYALLSVFNSSNTNSSNYVLSTSNIISGRITSLDANSSNYVLSTSNIISGRITSLDTNSSNYVLNTSNIISGRITNFQADWNTTVINKPTNFQADWNSTVINKPSLNFLPLSGGTMSGVITTYYDFVSAYVYDYQNRLRIYTDSQTSYIDFINTNQNTGSIIFRFQRNQDNGTLNERMRINTNGYVGIGTNNPTEVLEVNGNVKATAFYGSGANLTNLPTVSSQWITNNNNIYYNTGGVGIGKTNPSTILDVNGTITATTINATTNLQENGTNLTSKYLQLTGGTLSNYISINRGTAAAPSVGQYGGTGDRLILWEGTVGAYPYSFGISSASLWYSIPSGGNHRFYIGGTEYLTLSSAGNVGINTTSPSYTLQTLANVANDVPIGDFRHTNLSQGIGICYNSIIATGTNAIQDILIKPKGASGIFSVYTNGAERMRVGGNGNVGIGKTNPSTILDVNGTITATGFSGNGASITSLNYNNISNPPSLNYLPLSGGTMGGVLQTYYDFVSAYVMDYQNRLRIYTGSQESYIDFINTNQNTGSIIFRFQRNQDNGTLNERMRINTNGYIGIGTNNPTTTLDVNGYIRAKRLTITNTDTYTSGGVIPNSYKILTTIGLTNFPADTSEVINICATIEGNLWCKDSIAITSDQRIKTNIEDINDDSALQKILAIQPKTYNYIDKLKGTSNIYGFISQQIQEVIPEAVKITTDFIPNIYNIGLSSNINSSNTIINSSNVSIIDKINTSNIVKLIDENGKKLEDCMVLEVNSSNEFIIDKNIETSNVFIYGKKVDDFLILDKNYIYTLNVCATQELSRRIDILTSNYNNLLERVIALENK